MEAFAPTVVVHRAACRPRIAPRLVSGLGLDRGPDGAAAPKGDFVRSAVRLSLALGLLRPSQQAEHAAPALRARDPAFPEDAYRHIYWSWLLNRAYGPVFAERVTDAHEEGATYEFGEAPRKMDLHNNAVGRIYASAGVPAGELAARARTDARVVRAPHELVAR